MRARLALEEALEKTPSTRAMISVLESEARTAREEGAAVEEAVGAVLGAAQAMSSALTRLASVLAGHRSEGIQARLGSTIDDTAQSFALLATQLSNCVLSPVTKLNASLKTLEEHEKPEYDTADFEAWEALSRFAGLSRKAPLARLNEANQEVAESSRAFHVAALAYFAGLNGVEGRRSCGLLEPMLGLVYAFRAFASATSESLKSPGLSDFLARAQESIQCVHKDFRAEQSANQDVLDNLEGAESSSIYYAEAPEDLSSPPAQTLPTSASPRTQMSGYLHLKKRGTLTSSWSEAEYFYTAGRMLMRQGRDEMAAQVLLDLSDALSRPSTDELRPLGVVASLAASEDRRNTFSITLPPAAASLTSPSKQQRKPRVWILQATSARAALDWISVLNRLARATQEGKFPEEMERLSATSAPIPIGGSEPLTPQSTPNPMAMADLSSLPPQPIQFDLVEEEAEEEGQEGEDGQGGAKEFERWRVRFMGSMEVHSDSGESLVRETIRQVTAARAAHEIFAAAERELCIDAEGKASLWLRDVETGSRRLHLSLEDVAFWALHPDDNHLFGFISRCKGSPRPSFLCHVLHADDDANLIAKGFSAATQKAFQALVARRASEVETSQPSQEPSD